MQKIIAAFGFEIRDYQSGLLKDLSSRATAVPGGSVWTFPKGGKPKYEVQIVYTKAEFVAALDTQDAWVVYDGHSRYGQGPAFGPANPSPSSGLWIPDAKTYPDNPWGIHFRMGYDATDTEAIGDILTHSVTPREYDLTSTPPAAFLPSALVPAAKEAKAVSKKLSGAKLCPVKGAWRAFDDCNKTLAASTTSRGDKPLLGRHYYARLVGARAKQTPPDEYSTAVVVGSADLDKSTLKCSVLFMASCSSKVHFREALERRRKSLKSSCKFYLTANVCSAEHARTFIGRAFDGVDPVAGAKAMLKALNGVAESGLVGIY